MEPRALAVLEEPFQGYAYMSLFVAISGRDHLTASFEQQSCLC